ncbi:MAG: ABC transporter permease [Actinobacteria bacterium]|nr:ABC transporter permease [Actinomycetota bacterium]
MSRTPDAQAASGATPGLAAEESVDLAVGITEVPERTARSSGLRAVLRRNRLVTCAGAVTLLLLVLAVVGGPLAASITGHPPNRQYNNALNPEGVPIGAFERTYNAAGTAHDPNGQLFVLGADLLGRDQLVRALYGLRTSFTIAVGGAILAILGGIALGVTAGYFGGFTDAVISRAIEATLAFPTLLLGVGLALALGPGMLNVILVISIFGWYYPARIVRSVTIGVRNLQYIEAATSVGASVPRILFRHILPRLYSPMLIAGTSVVAANVLFEAGLSYLGLGVPPPTATWGQMLSDAVGSGYYQIDLWLAIVPGACLVIVVLTLNLLGDGLRDALDHRDSYL